MPDYRIRPATIGDLDVLVHHRVAMFLDMGTPMDEEAVAREFRRWVTEMLPSGTYRGWVVETAASHPAPHGSSPTVVAGGGICIFPWPPGPQSLGDRLAFVYNVYTEPAHRRQGLARKVMEAIHAWCREAGISTLALNSSVDGRSLYESLGYRVRPNPMMVCELLGSEARGGG
ncbi:MAG TPA: GNAT family N-acetyltransferase [Vicinamibacterales bacterium]|nr:GNAT family N-acetyltransferase [Vicinamibacterales bacterium]